MSEPTDVNQSQSTAAEDDGGPRRSRREMRQAEREAEREAILTGQQPLLTRRELKRLREEAAARRAALDAGEITPEQARALQDPLAEQPEIEIPNLKAAGIHAASSDSKEAAVDGPVTDSPAPGAISDVSAAPVPERGRGEGADEDSGSFGQPLAASAGAAGAGARTPMTRMESRRADRREASFHEPAVSPEDGSADESVASSLSASVAQDDRANALGPGHQWTAGDDERAGRMNGVAVEPAGGDTAESTDARVERAMWSAEDRVADRAALDADEGLTPLTSPATPSSSGSPSGWQPAPVQEFSDEPAPQVANASLSDDDIEDISAQPTGVMDAVDASALASYEPAPVAADEPAAVPERRSLLNREPSPSSAVAEEGIGTIDAPIGHVDAAEGTAPSPVANDAGPEASEAGATGASEGLPAWVDEPPVSGGPSRRPIVRVPSAAQGVRTVDNSTGELSDVRPVDEDLDGIDSPQWRLLRSESASAGSAPDGAGTFPMPAGAPTTPGAPETSIPEASSTSSAGDVAPAFSPYTPAPPVSETPVFASQSAAVASSSSQPLSSPSPSPQSVPAAAPIDANQGWGAPVPAGSTMPQQTSRTGRTIAIAALLAVIVIVVCVLAWVFFSRGSSSSANGLTGIVAGVPTWTSLLG